MEMGMEMGEYDVFVRFEQPFNVLVSADSEDSAELIVEGMDREDLVARIIDQIHEADFYVARVERLDA